jgi:hypothetical protein
MLKLIARFRTWIVNGLSLVILVLPDILNVLAATDWTGIIPDPYIRAFGVALAIVNIWMRPRPAVLPSDYEAQR